MINLRYHIVSIVSIFLALGIGVALGSTFIDGFVVSALETNVSNLEDQRNDARDELSTVSDELARVKAETAAKDITAIPLIGGGRMAEIPVMIIAVDGVDEGAVQTIQAAILGSDATYEGTIWLTGRLDLTDEENRAGVAEALGLVDDNEPLVRLALETRLARALFPAAPDPEASVLGGTAADIAAELLESVGEGLTVDAPTPTSQLANVLTELRDAAIVRYDNEFASTGALDDVPAYGTRFLIVSNDDAELDPIEILMPLFDTVVEDEIDVVIVALEPSPTDDAASPVSFVGMIRNDLDYSNVIATVDGATTFNGILAMLILADEGFVNHVGTGPGALSVFPVS